MAKATKTVLEIVEIQRETAKATLAHVRYPDGAEGAAWFPDFRVTIDAEAKTISMSAKLADEKKLELRSVGTRSAEVTIVREGDDGQVEVQVATGEKFWVESEAVNRDTGTVTLDARRMEGKLAAASLVAIPAPNWENEKSVGIDMVIELDENLGGRDLRARYFLPRSVISDGKAPIKTVLRAAAKAVDEKLGQKLANIFANSGGGWMVEIRNLTGDDTTWHYDDLAPHMPAGGFRGAAIDNRYN
jgi:hypothetical protein